MAQSGAVRTDWFIEGAGEVRQAAVLRKKLLKQLNSRPWTHHPAKAGC